MLACNPKIELMLAKWHRHMVDSGLSPSFSTSNTATTVDADGDQKSEFPKNGTRF